MTTCFFIWKGTENELKEFFKEINKVHQTIKFDHDYSKTEINFLDLTIYKDATGKLATKVYTKPADRQAYLHRNSAHPSHLKKSIPYGQALRLRRICSDLNEFNEASKNLKSRWEYRGYKEEEIMKQITQARIRNREELLQYKPKGAPPRIPFILTYNPQLHNAKEAINKHWSILQINPNMQNTFKEKPIMAYRRNKNLGGHPRPKEFEKRESNTKARYNRQKRRMQPLPSQERQPLLQTSSKHQHVS